jgi:hypothetical protein
VRRASFEQSPSSIVIRCWSVHAAVCTILVPSQYQQSYVSIAASATGGVTVDGTPTTLTTFPGGGTHRAARVPLAAGQHEITCADGCGITVYGYSDAVSYMFAGGLDLKPIVIL